MSLVVVERRMWCEVPMASGPHVELGMHKLRLELINFNKFFLDEMAHPLALDL